MTEVTLPMVVRRLPPMPVFYGNAALSFLAVMWFPDDLNAARKSVARMLLHRGAPQSALAEGIQIDNKYLAAILDDVADGRPDEKLVARRRYWSSACGQIIKVLFALINDADPRVRAVASWSEAIEAAERAVGRTLRERSTSSSFHPQLKRFQKSLHMCAAVEMMRDGVRVPTSVDGFMLNAMVIYEHLQAWHGTRPRANYLDAEAYWRWPGMAYDDTHGVPFIGFGFERLAPRGRVRRPRKNTL